MGITLVEEARSCWWCGIVLVAVVVLLLVTCVPSKGPCCCAMLLLGARVVGHICHGAALRALGQVTARRMAFRCWPVDLDMYLHLNNANYLRVAELSRWKQMAMTGLVTKSLANGWVSRREVACQGRHITDRHCPTHPDVFDRRAKGELFQTDRAISALRDPKRARSKRRQVDSLSPLLRGRSEDVRPHRDEGCGQAHVGQDSPPQRPRRSVSRSVDLGARPRGKMTTGGGGERERGGGVHVAAPRNVEFQSRVRRHIRFRLPAESRRRANPLIRGVCVHSRPSVLRVTEPPCPYQSKPSHARRCVPAMKSIRPLVRLTRRSSSLQHEAAGRPTGPRPANMNIYTLAHHP